MIARVKRIFIVIAAVSPANIRFTVDRIADMQHHRIKLPTLQKRTTIQEIFKAGKYAFFKICCRINNRSRIFSFSKGRLCNSGNGKRYQ